MTGEAAENTDTTLHIWKHDESDPWSCQDHMFLTKGGGIGFCVGGLCIVKPPSEWHALAAKEFEKPEKQ